MMDKSPHIRSIEKGALSSKKFIAFLLCESGFFILMAMMIKDQDLSILSQNLAFMTLSVTAGFGMVGYCLGQSFIDRYVRVATLMARTPNSQNQTSQEDE